MQRAADIVEVRELVAGRAGIVAKLEKPAAIAPSTPRPTPLHAYLGGLACLTIGIAQGMPFVLGAGLLWIAHVGFDRALGYGVKYSAGFGWTHLGVIGRKRSKHAASAK